MSTAHQNRVLAAAVLLCLTCVAAPEVLSHAQNRLASTHAEIRPDVSLFRSRIESLLNSPHAQRGYWGILIANRDTGEILYSQNEDHFFTPASNAKIFTTALALATLGSDYRFRTTLESPGIVSPDGQLSGNLILVGRGDPDLSNRKFPYDKRAEADGPVDRILGEMADAAVAKGLKSVDGDIVADDSYFPYDPYPAGWNVGDVFFRFGAPIGAIAINDNMVSVTMRAGASTTDPPTMTINPGGAADTFGMELSTAASSDKSGFAVVRQPGTNFLLLRGAISPGHAPMRIDIAMPDPAKTAAAELKALLEARGVRISGGIRAQHGPPPVTTASGDPVLLPTDTSANVPNLTVLAEHLSPPLIETVRVTNKVSQNLHAELLLRAVGREKIGVGSTAAGLKAERDFLRTAGVADGDVVLSDGSGLARDDLVTPRAAVTLLQWIAREPWGAAFLSTLPVAGVDGTLENRMKNSAATGLVQAKTGAEDHARGLSGYATTRGGDYLAFSIFVNNNVQHGNDATETVDAIATAMVETIGASSSKRTP
jgi:D-alanyl-D-alanine carboxypeptidase/D-alanyl-D-alanine-endopeptidase (penicillin-binding protein 4)